MCGLWPIVGSAGIKLVTAEVWDAKAAGRTGTYLSVPWVRQFSPVCMSETFTQIRPGIVFRDRKLFIFGNGQILVIRQWPQIRAWRKMGRHGWHTWRPQLHPRLIRLHEPQFKTAVTLPQTDQTASRPEFSFSLAEWIQYKLQRQRQFAHASWQFSEPIPLELRRAVRSFDESRYEVLQAFAGVEYALELYRSNPALFYTLVRNDQFCAIPPRARLAACRR